MTTLYLIRHAEPDASLKGRCYGTLDTGLSPTGREQAAHLSTRLADTNIAHIYASPRRRAVETAECLGRPVTIVPGFRELDFGDFEGRPYDEIARTHPALYQQWMDRPTEVQFPNGECFTQMQARVLEAHRALLARHENQTVAVVAHGGAARIILADALGLPAPNIFRLAQRYAALNLIRYYGQIPTVELING